MSERTNIQAVLEMAAPFLGTDPYWRSLWHWGQGAQKQADEIAALQAQYAEHEARITAIEVLQEQYAALQDAHEALQLEHEDLQAAYYVAQRELRRREKEGKTEDGLS